MKVSARLYRKIDADLFSLFVNGYAVWDMMRDALSAYVAGKSFYILPDVQLPVSKDERKNVRCYVDINDRDRETVELLLHIQRGYRTAFMKSLVRTAFLKMPYTEYFEPDFVNKYEKIDFSLLRDNNLDIRPLSSYRIEPKEDKRKHKKP